MFEKLKRVKVKIENIEEFMTDFCEINPIALRNSHLIENAGSFSKTPQYNKQQYTFKYGSYDTLDLLLGLGTSKRPAIGL